MSGHSKWSTIKRKKGLADQQRGQIFSKLTRTITVAVKQGGGVGDPNKNVKLRLAIEQAKTENMPKVNIQRAIERAQGADAEHLSEVVYEGFAPGNVAVIITATTDNTNRTYASVKTTLERSGGKLAGEGAVAYMFTKCGVVAFDRKHVSEEDVFAFAGRMGSLDLDETDDSYEVYIPFEAIGNVDKNLEGLSKTALDIFYKPTTTIVLSKDESAKLEALVEKLEDLEEVSRVYSNASED